MDAAEAMQPPISRRHFMGSNGNTPTLLRCKGYPCQHERRPLPSPPFGQNPLALEGSPGQDQQHGVDHNQDACDDEQVADNPQGD